jgi:hypothetical protein
MQAVVIFKIYPPRNNGTFAALAALYVRDPIDSCEPPAGGKWVPTWATSFGTAPLHMPDVIEDVLGCPVDGYVHEDDPEVTEANPAVRTIPAAVFYETGVPAIPDGVKGTNDLTFDLFDLQECLKSGWGML